MANIAYIKADPEVAKTARGPGHNQRATKERTMKILSRRCATLVVGIMFMVTGRAGAQQSAFNALIQLLPFGDDVSQALVDNLAAQATTFPIGSSSGGFTWTFDPALGVQTRRSNSFGSMFAERPLTNGRKKLNVSLAYQHTTFDSVGGQPLSALQSTGPVDLLDSHDRVIGAGTLTFNSSLGVSIDRTTASASYGITDRVDVGLIVPFGRTQVSGSSSAVLVSSQGSELGRISVNPTGSSSGVGDITLRGKVAVPSPRALQLAAGVDVRLPTGDTDKLLGVGATKTKLMVLGSSTRGMIAPHFNVGYTWAGDDTGSPFNVFNEVNYIVGADVAATPTVTVIGDLIGRTLRGAGTIEFVNEPGFPYFIAGTGNVNMLLGTVGAKVQVGGMWLLTASVVFPLNDGGVKPRVTPVIGFERAF